MIIFMGVAGSGKSVQGRKLADKLGLPWLSTGEFLRMLISGQRRKDMLSGKLLDDHEIITLIQKVFALIDSHKEFVLDGFPRTTNQADWLLNQAKHSQLKITAVVHLKASEEEVSKRLLGRGRQDDTEQAIKERFEEYEKASLPILEHFEQANVEIIEVDGEQPVEEVHRQILEKTEPLITS
jgi:adenylate kinase